MLLLLPPLTDILTSVQFWIIVFLTTVFTAAGIIVVLYRKLPQQTITSLNEVTDADAKLKATYKEQLTQAEARRCAEEKEWQRKLREAEQSRDLFHEDIKRLLREATIRIDSERDYQREIESLIEERRKQAEQIREMGVEKDGLLQRIAELQQGDHEN